MRFAYAPLNLCIELVEESVTSLIVENPVLFYELVSDIHLQIEGASGIVVFSEHDVPLVMDKSIVLLSQFIPLDMNSKPLLNALYAKLKKLSMTEQLFLRTNDLLGYIESYLSELTGQVDGDLTWERPSDVTGILKAMSIRFYDEHETLADRILDHMLMYREYIGERLFVTVNLQSYLSKQATQNLFRSVALHKLRLFCIENKAYALTAEMKQVIIDEDFCLI